ncbi:DMT family transporter [Streptomyces ziwulingensis]|uniref:EamA domain-containing protein n=1 Tax=Streptomyces ziwulingensis TaxID=1045501 RepID=A0ABP9B067_9ACTN
MRSRLDATSLLAVLLTVIAFSATAPLTAFATAPALTLALGRNALGLFTMGPVLLAIRRGELRGILRKERRLVRDRQRRAVLYSVLAGTALAVHFTTFMTGAKMTSVAMATAMVATQPVWQAAIATVQGTRLSRTAWLGLSVSVLGAVLASGADLRAGSAALVGDLLALAGAMALAGYTALSEQARPGLSTPLHSVLCSTVCAVELFVLCLATGTPVVVSTTETWIALLGLLLLPQLLGLFSLNFALGRAPATAVSVLLLLEAPAAAIIAWLWLGQLPGGIAYPGLLMIMIGVVAVVAGRTRDTGAVVPGVAGPLGHVPDLLHARTSTTPADDHSHLYDAAYDGRLDEVEAEIARRERRDIGAHGVRSPEAIGWIEVRADVARISGDSELAARLWTAAARFHADAPRSGPEAVRACLDRARLEWDNP